MQEKGFFNENNIDTKSGNKIKFFNYGKKGNWKKISKRNERVRIYLVMLVYS